MSTTKISERTTNIFKLLFFFAIILHFVEANQISTYRKLNLPLTSSIYFVFFSSRNAKKTQTDQSTSLLFLLCLKKRTHKPLKWHLQKPFSLVRTLLVYLVSMNVFILCDNWKTLIFVKVYRYSENLQTLCYCFL